MDATLANALDGAMSIAVNIPATIWMLLATFLVFIMVPSIGLLEAGLTRRKNVVHALMKSLSAVGIMSVVFVLFGFSLSFSDNESEVPVTSAVLVVRTTDREANGVLLISALSVTAVVTTIILIIAAAIVVGRGLRPLTAMAEHAERIAEGDRTLRLPVESSGDPAIARMASTVNLAFDVQEDAENRMRSFVADASHELRTPLQAITGFTENLQEAIRAFDQQRAPIYTDGPRTDIFGTPPAEPAGWWHEVGRPSGTKGGAFS